MKVHGGVESGDVNRAVKKAVEVARNNSAMGVSPTVLFFDEANTTGRLNCILRRKFKHSEFTQPIAKKPV